MFLKVQLPWNVIIAAENLDAKGLMLQRAIIIRLLGDFAARGGCPQGSEAWGPVEM
jgi:DNA-directed RNA polymerase-4/5 subunit 7